MNQLNESKRILILSCLTEGMAVRATARVTGTSKGAVLRLIAEVGPACEDFHQRFVHDVNCKRLELDEMHEFVFGKSRCLTGKRRDNPGEPNRADAEQAVRPAHECALERHQVPSVGFGDPSPLLQLVSPERGREDDSGAGVRFDGVPVHG